MRAMAPPVTSIMSLSLLRMQRYVVTSLGHSSIRVTSDRYAHLYPGGACRDGGRTRRALPRSDHGPITAPKRNRLASERESGTPVGSLTCTHSESGRRDS